MNRSIRASIVLFLSTSTSVFAADADFLRCRGMTDAAARLACYDTVVVPAAAPGAVSGKPDSRSAVPPAAAPQAVPQRAAAQPTSDQFGLENRLAPGTLDSIESTIPGKFEGWDAKTNIRLANGQVWQIADDSARYTNMVDAKVKIRRGALGSFYLEFEKINYSPRVKRIQ